MYRDLYTAHAMFLIVVAYVQRRLETQYSAKANESLRFIRGLMSFVSYAAIRSCQSTPQTSAHTTATSFSIIIKIRISELIMYSTVYTWLKSWAILCGLQLSPVIAGTCFLFRCASKFDNDSSNHCFFDFDIAFHWKYYCTTNGLRELGKVQECRVYSVEDEQRRTIDFVKVVS